LHNHDYFAVGQGLGLEYRQGLGKMAGLHQMISLEKTQCDVVAPFLLAQKAAALFYCLRAASGSFRRMALAQL